MRNSDDLRREILERYNLDPLGWRVFHSRDQQGFYNTIVTQNDRMWILKEEILNPFKSVGLGTTETLTQPLSDENPFFGFRPVSEKQFKDIIDSETSMDTITSILRQKPKSLGDLNSPVALQGPLTYTKDLSTLIPKTWNSIDIRIRSELNKLIEKKHPFLRSIYG